MGLKIFIGAAVLTLLYNLFFFDSTWQIGWGLLFLALNTYFFLTRKSPTQTKLGLLAGGLATVFGFFNGIYDNIFIQVINVMTATFLSFAALFFFNLDSKFSYQFKSIIVAPFRVIIRALENGVGYLNSSPWSGEGKHKHTQSALVRGLFVAIPVSVILLLLLSHADPIFGKYISGFTHNFSARLVVTVGVFLVTFFIAFTKIEKDFDDVHHTPSEGKAFELGLIATIIAAILWGFIFFQVKYLFATVGEQELHTLGISLQTYSEYLRRGFVELTLVTAITSAVLYYITRTINQLKSSQRLIIQILASILTAGIVMIMVSAGKRLLLQIDTHGLTEIRIFGFFFLAELIVIVGMLFVSLFYTMPAKRFFLTIGSVSIVLLVALNLMNVDAYIFKHDPPTINGKVDFEFLADQGSSAHDGWIAAEKYARTEVESLEKEPYNPSSGSSRNYNAQWILSRLERNYVFLDRKYGKGERISPISYSGFYQPKDSYKFVSYNLAEKRAYDALKASGITIKGLQDLITRNQKMIDKASGITPTPTLVPSTTPMVDPNQQ